MSAEIIKKDEVKPVKLGSTYDMLMMSEEKSLNKTQDLRNQMVDNYIAEKGLPTTPREMEVFNGVLNSTDDQTFKLIKIRQGTEDKEKTEDAVSLVLEILKGVAVPKAVNAPAVNTTIPTEYVPSEIAQGEDVIEYEELSMDEIIGDDK